MRRMARHDELPFRLIHKKRPNSINTFSPISAALAALGRPDIRIVVGGVIPQQDYAELFAAGAAAIFGPGTPIPGAAREVLAAISKKF